MADEQAALEYAIASQRDRRNLTDADIVRCVLAVDKIKISGQRTDLASVGARSGKSSQDTAASVGTSSRKVEKVRSIKANSPELLADVVIATNPPDDTFRL